MMSQPTSAALPVHLTGGPLVTPETLTLTQAATSWLRWLEAHHYPENTRRSYGEGLSMFLRYAAGANLRRPSDATVLHLDGFFLWLHERGCGASSVSHRRSVLISFWRWLEHEGLADRNVAARTYPIKTAKRMPRYLEPHQLETFLAKLAALTDLRGRRDFAIVATFFYGGFRVSELVALRLTDVDLTARRIRVLAGKGNKDRTGVMPPKLVPILEDYLTNVRPPLVGRQMGRLRRTRRSPNWQLQYYVGGGRCATRSTGTPDEAEARRVLLASAPQPTPAPWLFVNASGTNAHRLARAGKPLLTRSVHAIIRDRARQLMGVKLTPHGLRHTCATWMLYHGAALETVQRHLGHSDIKTTMIYLHVPQRRQEDEIAQVFA
jgi:integrase/recombinase XerD